MAKIKTKKDIIDQIAQDADISKKAAADAYDSIVAIVYKGAKAKDGFTLPGLGKFYKARQKARKGIIQFGKKKGQAYKSPAKTVLRFKVSKKAKDGVIPQGKK
ncbi:MAG: HU family DNA-binding protein [Candidatus Auribacterota bacterium]|nr:HU family DNA-binding protein [Candidatus Auribacterota bacterium]